MCSFTLYSDTTTSFLLLPHPPPPCPILSSSSSFFPSISLSPSLHPLPTPPLPTPLLHSLSTLPLFPTLPILLPTLIQSPLSPVLSSPFPSSSPQRFYKKAAAFVLRAVAKHSPELAQAVVDCGALDSLVICLEEFDPGVKEAAAWALGYIARHNGGKYVCGRERRGLVWYGVVCCGVM